MHMIQFKKLTFKSILLLLIALLSIISLTTLTFSWIYLDREREHQLQTSNFTLTCDVYYLQSDNSRVQGSNFIDANTGYYIVNISNPSAQNYATKLKIDVKYKGITRAYLRVYIGDMWLVSNKAIFKMDTSFATPLGAWLDNRIYDTYYYYVAGSGTTKGMVYCDTLTEEKTYNFISGINDFARIDGGTLYLNIRADAVQINRMNAFWGISQLPE